ncbi:MAG: helix-turn-helix domain-containing protein [Eubacteriaceae bacterium]|nr:helix-turn-helix domain-containing protein [Eubacteriaceae bacterium]
MSIGDRIKTIRNYRKMTLRELGLAVGFDENSANVRIAQYESGTRTPKEDMVKRIANVLGVNHRFISTPTVDSDEDLMYTLLELDWQNPLELIEIGDAASNDAELVAISFNSEGINKYLSEWVVVKKRLSDGQISENDYLEWKLGWYNNSKLDGLDA